SRAASRARASRSYSTCAAAHRSLRGRSQLSAYDACCSGVILVITAASARIPGRRRSKPPFYRFWLARTSCPFSPFSGMQARDVRSRQGITLPDSAADLPGFYVPTALAASRGRLGRHLRQAAAGGDYRLL